MSNTYREIFDEEDTETLLLLCNKQLKIHERNLKTRKHESDVSEYNRIKTQEKKRDHINSIIDKLIDESL